MNGPLNLNMQFFANPAEPAKVFNTPNYSGDLYTASPIETPFVSLIGGLGGTKALVTQNFEFPTCSLYEHPEAAQPAISEDASMTAPAPYTYVRTQEKNVTQIFHEKISVSYAKQSNSSRLSGINTAGQQNNAPNEVDFQTARKLEKIARDMEFTFLNGTYQLATSSAEINKTRGMFEAAGTQLAAAGAALDKAMIDNILREAWSSGALFKEFYLFVNGTQKQKLTSIYNIVNGFNLPADRNIGGLNIVRIETDFGDITIALDKFVPEDSLLGVDLSVIAPVEQPVPGKGNFFREELSKNGAGEELQIFGQAGLDHGPAFMHLAITGLAV